MVARKPPPRWWCGVVVLKCRAQLSSASDFWGLWGPDKKLPKIRWRVEHEVEVVDN